jgi:hypothetical protein
MGYILLWIESLAVSLLLVATLVACIGRLRRRWVQVALAILVALVPLAAYVGLTSLAGIMKFNVGMSGTRFYPILTLTVLFAIGATRVLYRGLRRGAGQPRRPVAGSWPRGKLAVGLGVAIALHLMTFWNLDLAARQWLAAHQAEAGALALSVAPARIPDRENAALVYQQAFEAMGPEESWSKGWDQKWDKWLEGETTDFDAQEPKLREFLKQQTSALVLLRQAAREPGCYFDRDYGRPSVDMLLPELSHLRTAARLLALDARCKAANGDFRRALEDVQAMFAMAEHVSSEPILISLLVSISVERMAIDALQSVFTSGKASAEELAVLNVDAGFRYSRCLERAFRMEEAFELSICCQMGVVWDNRMLYPGTGGGVRGAASVYRVFMLSEDVAALRGAMLKLRGLAALPYYQAKNDLERFGEELKGHSGGFLARLLMPALFKCAEAAAEGDARHRVVLVALAMSRYRAANDHFPDKLEDLTPDWITAVPRDPFDGKPIRLKRTDAGLIVYSIGPDITDNGGTPFDSKKRIGDVTFTLSPP